MILKLNDIIIEIMITNLNLNDFKIKWRYNLNFDVKLHS